MCIVWECKKKLIDISYLSENSEKEQKNDEKSIKIDEKMQIFEKNLTDVPDSTLDTMEELTIDDLPDDDLVNPYETKRKQNRDYHLNDASLTAFKVWGALLVILREDNHMTIHTAGGDIREISLSDFILTIVVREEYLFNILSSEDNLEILNDEIKKINDKLSINVVYKDSKDKYSKENEEKLRILFGDEISIQ